MPPKNPYAEFQQPAATANPYAAFQQPAADPTPGSGVVNGVQLPGFPATPAPVMQPSILGRDATPGTAGQRLFGDKPVSNSLSVVGSHLKNLVAGPYKAFTAPPRTGAENAVQAQGPPGSLGLYRTLVQPTVDNGKAAYDAFTSGDVNTGAQRTMDAVPIAGPWARGIENDAKTYGAIPAMLGLGTDIAAPKAAEGLYGGAMKAAGAGLRAAGTTPDALKIAHTRALVPGSPGELLTRALKPPVTMPDFEQSVEASLPKIAPQNPSGVSGFAAAAKNAQGAEQSWYKGLTDPLRPFKVDASPIADAQMRSIPIMDQIEKPAVATPGGTKFLNVSDGDGGTMRMGAPYGGEPKGGIFNDTAAKAQNYQRPMPLGVIDDVRKDSGAKLDAFFAKNGGDKYAALSNPETARVAAVNDASQKLAYNNYSRLSAAGRTDGGIPAPEIAANQTLYGQLKDVADVAGKRATVAGRANPMSLQETLALKPSPMGIVDYVGQRLFKGLTNSDALTNAALDRFASPSRPSMPPRNTFVGQGLYDTGNAVTGGSQASPFFAPSIASKGEIKKKGLFN